MFLATHKLRGGIGWWGRFCPPDPGYAPGVGTVVSGCWRRFWSSPPLTLNGWVAFNVPTTVSAAGTGLLTLIAGVHAYLWATTPAAPAVFVGWAAGLIAACLVAAVLLWAPTAWVARLGWWLGSAAGAVYLGGYALTRAVALTGLAGLTGRWDVAPANGMLVCAVLFLTVYATVLSGINVARPQRQVWHD